MGRLPAAFGMVLGDALISGITLGSEFDPVATGILGTVSLIGIGLTAWQVADAFFTGQDQATNA